MEAQLDRKADGPEKTEAILPETGGRLADGPDRFGPEVTLALNEIEHLLLEGVEKHAVDGEVAPLGVFFRRGESDGGRTATVQIGAVDPEGGDFKHMIALLEADHPKGFSLGIGGFGKDGLHLVGGGGSGDVDIRVRPVEQSVADAASGINGLMAGLGESSDHGFGCGMADHLLMGDFRVR